MRPRPVLHETEDETKTNYCETETETETETGTKSFLETTLISRQEQNRREPRRLQVFDKTSTQKPSDFTGERREASVTQTTSYAATSPTAVRFLSTKMRWRGGRRKAATEAPSVMR